MSEARSKASTAAPEPGPGERELVITRIIDGPRARVFSAWTDARQLPQWWGPHGMTTPVCEMDLRPGGVFRTVMRSPDGTEYPTKGVFLEIAEPERLVFTDAFDEGFQPSAESLMTAVVTFDEHEGKTRLTARALHKSVADREKHEQMGFATGWGEMLERLQAHVSKPTADRDLVVTRVVNAPPSRVFEAWTDPSHFKQWWGPHGFTNPVCELDVRPGGALRVDMRAPDGTVYPMAGVYREIVEPRRLVFTSAPLGKDGQPVFEVLNTMTLAEQGGKTSLTNRARVVKWTAAAAPYLAGMQAGWTQSLERLEAHVAKA